MKKEFILLFAIILFVSFSTLLLFHSGKINVNITGFSTYLQSNQSEFDQGTYENTEWNGSAVVLSGQNLTGTYTSEVFNCGSSTGASWNNISWSEEHYNQELENNQQVSLMSGNTLLLHMNDEPVSSSPVQDSKGNNDGSPSGDASIITGKLNNAGSFDGNGDYINAGNGESLDLTNTITVSAWINLDVRKPAHGYHHSIADRCGDNQNGYWFYVGNNGKLGFLAFTSGDYDAVGSSADVSVGEWVHITATYNRSAEKEVKLYINGVLDTENTLSKQVGSSNNNLIMGDRGNLHYLDGKLDEVAIYNKVLTSSEISDLYNSGNGYEHSGTEEGLVSVWQMNENSWVSIAEDASGNENDGTAGGNPTFQQQGKLNHSIEFDGDDYFYIENNETLHSDDGTISAWVKTTNDNYETIISFGDDNDQALFSLAIGDGSTGFLENELITIIADTVSGTTNRVGYTTSIREELFDGNWHNIILTADTEYKIYIDGEQKTLTVGIGNNDGLFTDIHSIDNSRIGSRNTDGSGEGRFFNGNIDEIAMWNRSLNEEEIEEIYKKGALKLNLSVRSCDNSQCLGENFTDINDHSPQNLSLDNNQYFQYKFNFETGNSQIPPILNSVSFDYTLLNTPPSVSIQKPSEGATYGYNESLKLNFSATDNDNNIESCWYNIEGQNTTIPCENTTFSVSGDGNYLLTLYVNDTQGETASDNVSFSVQIGSPTIMTSPKTKTYFNKTNITLYYTPSDIDLDSCELWINSTGIFKKNQTQLNPINNQQNNFTLNLTEDTYKWNIKCNDSQGNEAFNGNKTFTIDTSPPLLTLQEPQGTKDSRTVEAKWAVEDRNINICHYNVYRGSNIEIANTTVNCSLNSTTFSLTLDADFTFNFYSQDLSSNLNHSSLNFTIDTSEESSTTSSGGSSSGGGGGGGFFISKNILKFSNLNNIIANPGETKKMAVTVENAVFSFLNNCKLKSIGSYSSWITSRGITGLSKGEKQDFEFTLNIPENAKPGKYHINLLVNCDETNQSTNFTAEILDKKLDLKLEKVERKKDFIDINFSLTELAGKNQEITIEILLLNKDERINKTTKQITLNAKTKKYLTEKVKIPPELKGNFELLLNAKSEISSVFVQEEVILGQTSPLGGLAIFLNEPRTGILFSIFLIILFIVLAILIIRKMLSNKKANI